MSIAHMWTFTEETLQTKLGNVTEVRATSPDGTQRTRWKLAKDGRSARAWAEHDVTTGRVQRLDRGVWIEDFRTFGRG
jgi:hypothetical protein